MLTLFTLLNFARAYSWVDDPEVQASNCRFQSRTHQFASAITSWDSQHRRFDIDRQGCETQQRLAILANVTARSGVTVMADEGVTEFREPGQTGPLTQCHYAVERGASVPRLILEMNGTIKTKHGFSTEDQARIRRAVRRLVHVSCAPMVSARATSSPT